MTFATLASVKLRLAGHERIETGRDGRDGPLLEDYLIEGIVLKRLGREQNLDPRTIRKQIKRAIERLREAQRHLP